MIELFIQAVKNLLRSKTRSLLTMCGTGIGVFAVTVISGAGSIGTEQMRAVLDTMGVNSALVESSEGEGINTLSALDVECFAGLQGVEKAMPLMAAYTETNMLGTDVSCYAWGIDSDAAEIISLEAVHGRLITHEDTAAKARVCVVDQSIAEETYGRSNIVGKKISLLFGGSYQEYEIVGVATSGLSGLQNVMQGFIPQFVYLPYTTMQQITGRTDFDKIALLLNDVGQADNEIIDKITERVNAIKQTDNGYSVTNLLAQKKQICGILDTSTTVLTLIAAISLLVSGITVLTTMLVSVGERTREIGIKKSIGAKNTDILWEFLAESVLLTATGSMAGILLGMVLCFAGCIAVGIGFSINLTPIIFTFIFSVLLGAIFGAYPAVKAARLNPAQALTR